MDAYAIMMIGGCIGVGIFSGAVMPLTIPGPLRLIAGVGLGAWMSSALILIRAILLAVS